MRAVPRPEKKRPASKQRSGLRAAMRREELLRVATAVFCEHGYAATSTKRIAMAAGVAEGLVFHYFGSKEALLLAVASRPDTFAGRARAIVEQAGDRSARDVLADIAQGFVATSREERDFVGFMIAESHSHPLLREMLRRAHEAMIERVAGLFEKRKESGELLPDADVHAMLTGFLGGFFFFFSQHRSLTQIAWRKTALRFASSWAEQCWRGVAKNVGGGAYGQQREET